MSKINVIVPHALAQKEATARIKKLLKEIKSQYGKKISNLKETWKDDQGEFSFEVMNYEVAGTLEVTPKQVRFSGDLPWQAALFKGKIESVIKERATDLLS